MELNTTSRRRQARLALFGVLGTGWVGAVIGATLRNRAILAIGIGLTGAANLAAVKLMFESKSAIARNAGDLRQLTASTDERFVALSRTVERTAESLAEVGRTVDAGASSAAERMNDLQRAIRAQRAELAAFVEAGEVRPDELGDSPQPLRRHPPRQTGRTGELALSGSLEGLSTRRDPKKRPELPQETSVNSATKDPGSGGSMPGNA